MQIASARDELTSPTGLRLVMRRHPLFSFFFMAYAFSWIVWIPFVLAVWHIMPTNTFSALTFPIGTFLGPTLSAFIMTSIMEGDVGLGRLLHRFAFWRVGLRWYLFILLGIPALSVLGIIVLPGALASFKAPTPIFLVECLEQVFVAELRSFAWNPPPCCSMDLLASAAFPDAGAAWRTRNHLRDLPQELSYFLPALHRSRHHHYLGLQPYPRQPVHRHLVACERGRQSISTTFSSPNCDQH
jgi:hypothetical protein